MFFNNLERVLNFQHSSSLTVRYISQPNRTSEFSGLYLTSSFGQHIRYHFVTFTILQFDFIHCNHFSDVMEFNIDMICSTMMLEVLCY